MFPFGNMNRLHTQKSCDLEFLVKTLIAGPYPFSMHEIKIINNNNNNNNNDINNNNSSSNNNKNNNNNSNKNDMK